MRSLLAGAASIALLVSASAARACGGGPEFYGRWSLDHRDYSFESGLPFLSPGNDSRINLQFLMMDVHPRPLRNPGVVSAAVAKIDFNSDRVEAGPVERASSAMPALFSMSDLETALNPDVGAARRPSAEDGAGKSTSFADGEGSRCISFDGGKLAFLAAVQAEPGLSAVERSLLADARNKMTPDCVNSSGGDPSLPDPLSGASQPSAAARDFATYLGRQALTEALSSGRLRKLAKAENAWLQETARYMVARTLLNKAQIGAFTSFDQVAEPKVTDRDLLAASEVELKAYLAAYPAGRYAASARGLLRRTYWLGGDKTRLSAEYAWQIAHLGAPRSISANPIWRRRSTPNI